MQQNTITESEIYKVNKINTKIPSELIFVKIRIRTDFKVPVRDRRGCGLMDPIVINFFFVQNQHFSSKNIKLSKVSKPLSRFPKVNSGNTGPLRRKFTVGKNLLNPLVAQHIHTAHVLVAVDLSCTSVFPMTSNSF